jgi:hypothetical protein
MRCGLAAADCITDHWCPALGGRKEPAGWRAACPACGAERALSVQVKGRYPAWNLFCQCDRADVRAKLAALLPSCVSVRYSPKRAGRDQLAALALADIPPQSLRLGLLELAGMPTAEALARLGVGPTHKHRVISALRRAQRLPVSVSRRRSAPLPVSVTPGLPISVSLCRS